jgi:hypothetical protein
LKSQNEAAPARRIRFGADAALGRTLEIPADFPGRRGTDHELRQLRSYVRRLQQRLDPRRAGAAVAGKALSQNFTSFQ